MKQSKGRKFQLSIRLDREQIDYVQDISEKDGISKSEAVRRIISNHKNPSNGFNQR